MPNHAAPALVLREGDREELVRWTRASSGSAGLATRARIVLAAAEGQTNTGIAERVGVSRPTVLAWRTRYEADGLAGLHDEPRSGRPREIDRLDVITATLTAPPKKYGITHWSTRLLGAHLGISDHTVAQTWREYGVQPWRSESFRFSTDPQLEAKVVDVVGLYLNPPENAVVLSIDEKSQIQALDRTAPVLPMQPHLIERRSHDYIRHGTSTLFAALDIATGKITGRMADRHRHQEFLTFLRQIARVYPAQDLHLIMDNYAAHKHANVKAWLAENPRITVHFTPTHASWMNMVECWFSMAERQAIHRGTYRSVRELNAKIRAYINGWNDRCHPFTWTKTADQILAKANRKKTSPAEH
jgi:transposase